MRARTAFGLAATAGALLVCASHAAAVPGASVKETAAKTSPLEGRAKGRSAKIRAFANEWLGTSYLWGGDTKAGTDCSGYSREMYRRLFNVELPRTTHDQIHLGMSVPLIEGALGKNFEPGDMFFYVDRTGTPNHVVVYIGDGQFTHSAGGRGVVIEGMKALWGRRIVGRRVLVPGSKIGGPTGAIPAAGPIVAIEVPCPPSVRAKQEHVRRFMNEPIGDLRALGITEICEWKALGKELTRRGGATAQTNLKTIDLAVQYLESIEYLQGQL